LYTLHILRYTFCCLQLVYVSVANIRKDRLMNQSQLPASLQPAPNFESVPMIQLLKEENFLQLFNLLEVLYRVCQLDDYKDMWASMMESRLEDSSSSCLEDSTDSPYDNPHERVKPLPADILLYNAWDLILLLPTNVDIKNRIIGGEFESAEKWKHVLSLEQKFRLLYILQILDGLTLPFLKSNKSEGLGGDSSGDSDSSLSDIDRELSPYESCSFAWVRRLFKSGMVSQLLNLFLCQQLNPSCDLDEWSLNALAYIIKILTRIGLVNVSYEEEKPPPSSSAGAGGSEESPGAVEEPTTTISSSVHTASTEVPSSPRGKGKPLKRHVFRARYRSTEVENVVVIHQFNQVSLYLLTFFLLCLRYHATVKDL